MLHPFLENFREEHAQILRALNSCVQERNWSEYFKIAREQVFDRHEQREEIFLFPAIATKREIRSGGPMCMLYYDMHTQSPPLKRAAVICDEPLIVARENGAPHLKEIFESQSPACIPIEDHMAMEQILKKAERDKASLELLATVHLAILKIHFEKEDCCLLPMSASLLGAEEMNRLMSESASLRIHL